MFIFRFKSRLYSFYIISIWKPKSKAINHIGLRMLKALSAYKGYENNSNMSRDIYYIYHLVWVVQDICLTEHKYRSYDITS